jgi:hypothetical protein
MGFFDSWSDLVAAATPWSTLEAEAPATEEKEETSEVSVCFLSALGGVCRRMDLRGIGFGQELQLSSRPSIVLGLEVRMRLGGGRVRAARICLPGVALREEDLQVLAEVCEFV